MHCKNYRRYFPLNCSDIGLSSVLSFVLEDMPKTRQRVFFFIEFIFPNLIYQLFAWLLENLLSPAFTKWFLCLECLWDRPISETEMSVNLILNSWQRLLLRLFNKSLQMIWEFRTYAVPIRSESISNIPETGTATAKRCVHKLTLE